MDGFENVDVSHIKDNEYCLTTTGPDENTSDEMRNLAQMGEYTDFTIRMHDGYDFHC